MSAVTAQVALGLPVTLAVFVVSLTATLWARYIQSFYFPVENVLWDDFAAMWAVNNFVFHVCSPFAEYAQKEKGGFAGDVSRGYLVRIYPQEI